MQYVKRHYEENHKEVKEINLTQPKVYTETEFELAVENRVKAERSKWSEKEVKVEQTAFNTEADLERLQQQYHSLKENYDTLLNMNSNASPSVTTNDIDEKVIATLKNEFAERLIDSRKRSEEMLTNQIKKLSADSSEILKELDVMHSAMTDLSKRYERARELINQMKKREDHYEEKMREYADNLKNSEENCRIVSRNCDEQLEAANSRIEQIKTEYERERIKMEASVKRLEIENRSLQVKYNDKENEANQLIQICDQLMGVKEAELDQEQETTES